MAYFDESLKDQTFAAIAARLLTEVGGVEPMLRGISEERAGVPRATGKWSRKETLGHLIDSASNNHQRFVRGQLTDDLKLPGYAQQSWVDLQRYQERQWRDLVEFWYAYNRHLAHVLGGIPESARTTRCQIGDKDPVTLSHLALDYVGHMQHHLRQILE